MQGKHSILYKMKLNKKQKAGLASICDDLVKATIIGLTINQNATQGSFISRLIYTLSWYCTAVVFLVFSLLFRRK